MSIQFGSLPVILTAVFFVLKLTSVIAWSWWLVFLPLLIVGGIWIIFVIIGLLIAGIAAARMW